MRNLFAGLGLAIVSVAAIAGTAAADTSVYNRYETKHIYGGYESTRGHIDIDSTIRSYTNSQSVKVETYGGDVNISNASFDGKKIRANAHSSNRRVVDPVSIITVVNQNESVVTTESINLDTYSRNYFSGTERIHEVGNTTR